MTTSEKTFTGEGEVGDYTLSQDFIDAIRLNTTWDHYDEAELKAAGYEVLSGPRLTGDGYYESCIVAIEGNQIEITA